MSSSSHIESLRRHTAAIQISMSGPKLTEFLDPSKVLVGAGPPILEEHRQQFAYGLSKQGRRMIYFEFASGADAPTRMHVAEPQRRGVSWFEDCVLWAGPGHAEMELVPATPGSRGRYLSRNGGLRFSPDGPAVERPGDVERGIERARTRFGHTVRALAPEDFAGQQLVDTTHGPSWWQHHGFAMRP